MPGAVHSGIRCPKQSFGDGSTRGLDWRSTRFISPSGVSGVAKAVLGLSVALALLGYIVAGGRQPNELD